MFLYFVCMYDEILETAITFDEASHTYYFQLELLQIWTISTFFKFFYEGGLSK